MSAKIVFFGSQKYEQDAFEKANQTFGYSILYKTESLNPKTASYAKDTQVICIFVNDVVDRAMVDMLYSMGTRLIALRCTGHEKVDLEACKNKIKVVYVPEYSPYSVAEFSAGLILSLNRKIHLAYARTTHLNFSIDGLKGFDLHGKTIGIIGVGRIGKAAIEIFKGFGMRVLAYDIDPVQIQKASAEPASLATLYKESDIISLHAPLTKENKHMIDKKAISQMKKGVMIINTGRGPLINTIDLLEGLESGKIGSAALDVYEHEKDVFYQDHSKEGIKDDLLKRLLKHPSVLITSHQAFFTEEAMSMIAKTTLLSMQEFLDAKPLRYELKG